MEALSIEDWIGRPLTWARSSGNPCPLVTLVPPYSALVLQALVEALLYTVSDSDFERIAQTATDEDNVGKLENLNSRHRLHFDSRTNPSRGSLIGSDLGCVIELTRTKTISGTLRLGFESFSAQWLPRPSFPAIRARN